MAAVANSGEKRREVLRSQACDTLSAITFVNRSGRPARVFWLNYKGQRVQYAILQGSEPFYITTYVSHPWLCRDAETGDVLLAGGKDIYLPEASSENDPSTVFIDIPVYTLRERCLQIVRTIHREQLKEQLKHMNIPDVLKLDLMRKENIPYHIRVQIM